ncbi:MAG: group 1 glycosyl transferase [uncultured bacterium]|nr:MAG: group 1 glycosyl transferase [uncultured bacterium]HBR71535.1 hypothetical protein [Candidatus Moranbacteria bacterium]
MQSFLIKIGKILNVLKRDGFFRGLKRIFRVFSLRFRRVGEGEVLFVTGGLGDSAMYRARNVAEELDLNGISTAVAYADNPLFEKYVKQFNIFVFHRVLYSKKVQKFIEEIKKQKKEIIFDTDDLLYEEEFIKNTDYFKNINSLEKKLYENGLGSEIVNDDYVKVCTTTTNFLAEKLREKGKKVFVVPNKLSQQDLEIVQAVNYKRSASHIPHSSIRIGYFSGTASHNQDFAQITQPLEDILEKYKNVELFLVGPLDVESSLNKFKERIVQLPYVPREDHFENISKVDINLAPLVVGDPYCESKSELKFFEAAILGVPTVASATQTFCEAILDGVDGFTAKSENEWFEKLEKLILEKELRKKMGEKAREKVLKKYTTQNAKNEEYYNYLKNKTR